MPQTRDDIFNQIVGMPNGSNLLSQGINKLVDALKKKGVTHKSAVKPVQKQVNSDALMQALAQLNLNEEQLNGVVGIVGDMVQQLGNQDMEGSHMLPEEESPELEISLEEDAIDEVIDEEVIDEKAVDIPAIAEQLSAIADMLRAMIDDQAGMESEVASMKSALKQATDTQREKGASLESRIASLEKLARAMPKRASTNADTAIDGDKLPEGVKSATRKFDPFFGVEVHE
jgi:hypothetical protein